MSTTPKTLGERVAHLRRAKGFTQRELSIAAGVDDSTLSRIERGDSLGSLDVLARLARKLGTTVDALLPTDQTTRKA